MELINIIVAFTYFLLGMIIGSFLNVIVLRYNTGKLLIGRSGCFSCGKALSWFELVPVFSFIFQWGKCRLCGSRISRQYPTVELLTGVVFLGIFLKFYDLFFISTVQFSLMSVYFMVLFSLLIVIFVYDLKHKIIPDALVYTFGTLSLGGLFFDSATLDIVYPTLLHLSAGPLLFLPLFLIWFLSRGRWMGLGDAKLLLGMGWLLGLTVGGSMVILSFWIGALVSMILIIFSLLLSHKSRFTMKSEIPFAPFLITGFLIAFFFNINIFNFVL